MSQIYLSIGSNLGNRRRFLRLALDSISEFCTIIQTSSTYETKPWGNPNQPKFLNLCLAVSTSLTPEDLLKHLKKIERDLGRQKTEKWAEREIDIDIIFYKDLILDSAALTLPHPRVEERQFVLVPLAEIAPGFVHPRLKKTIGELAKSLGEQDVRQLTKIMGIINTTPDSFSDGGELNNEDALKQKVREMIDAGVDIIDIGGESTRPGHQKINADEELLRILPAIKTVRDISPTIPISIDTQKSQVAERALEAGANIINDISAFSDEKMPEIVKKFNVQVILMRNRPLDPEDIVGSCRNLFQEIIENCIALGIDKGRIILDPGLGFGDLLSGDFSALPGGDPSANTELVLSIKDYSLNLPVLIGASRKRFLGTMSGQPDAKKRLNESLAFAVLADYSGVAILRVHDVRETVKILGSHR